MKSQAVEGTYIPTSGYGWFRCGWVKISGNRTVSFAVTKREMFSGCGKMLYSHDCKGYMLAVKQVCRGCLRLILLVLPIACPPTHYGT